MRATSAARIRSRHSRVWRRAAAAAARASESARRWCSSRGAALLERPRLLGQRVALGRQRLDALLELRAPQLQRIERPQRLRGHPRLRLPGRLGAAGAPLRQHRAVDHLAARLGLGRLGLEQLGGAARSSSPAGIGSAERSPLAHSSHSPARATASGTR